MDANHRHPSSEHMSQSSEPPIALVLQPGAQLNGSKDKDAKVVFEADTPFLDLNVDGDDKKEKGDDDDYDPFDDDFGDEEVSGGGANVLGRGVLVMQRGVRGMVDWVNQKCQGHLTTVIVLLLYVAYFIYAMDYRFGDEGSIRLVWCTVLGVLIVCRHKLRQLTSRCLARCYHPPLSPRATSRLGTAKFFFRWMLYGGVGAFMGYVIVDVAIRDADKLRSLPGIFVFLLICFLFSSHPSRVNWHTVYWSLGIQFILAVLVMRWEGGKEVVLWIQSRLDNFFANGIPASKLLFGESYTDHYIVFGAFPIVFLTNAALSMLYHVGAMQFLISTIGNALHFILDTSPIESMGVSASIFVEGAIALLSVRPYLDTMTKSELFTVTTACLASIGGAYLAILSQIGIPIEFMLPAMVISAPATFAVCKLIVPETKKPKKHKYGSDLPPEMTHSSLLEAANYGAVSVVTMVANVLVSAFALFSLIAFINSTLTWFGLRVGIESLTMEKILSYVFYPFAYLMGVEVRDCRNVGMLMGLRISSASFLSMLKMMQLVGNRYQFQQYSLQMPNATVSYIGDHIVLDQWNVTLVDGYISRRTEMIATYALCGFSGVLSTFMTISIMGTLVPKRSSWLINMALPLIIAGNLANFMVGCFAGLLAEMD